MYELVLPRLATKWTLAEALRNAKVMRYLTRPDTSDITITTRIDILLPYLGKASLHHHQQISGAGPSNAQRGSRTVSGRLRTWHTGFAAAEAKSDYRDAAAVALMFGIVAGRP